MITMPTPAGTTENQIHIPEHPQPTCLCDVQCSHPVGIYPHGGATENRKLNSISSSQRACLPGCFGKVMRDVHSSSTAILSLLVSYPRPPPGWRRRITEAGRLGVLRLIISILDCFLCSLVSDDHGRLMSHPTPVERTQTVILCLCKVISTTRRLTYERFKG